MIRIPKNTFLLMCLFIGFCNVSPTMAKDQVWTGSWATASQLVEPNNMPPAPGLANNTIRQIIRVSLGGKSIRLQFTNLFSKSPLTLKSVGIAVSKGGRNRCENQ